ncbi:MAG: uroporphyrinogen decarboxylase family protein [Ignavibacteriaceae bacterium]|jgi:uroporphyrinogen decarboxylase|nr:uroporphyrinogen decarboxylase family protein [Ignavibacteriaceae bacterium]
MKFNPKPDIESFLKIIRNQACNYIPIAELGVHPLIKERFIGKKIIGLEEEIEFWFKAGYDYIKLQPKADFNPAKIGLSSNLSYNDDGTVFRKWASENNGVITDSESFNKYQFPAKGDFSYENFEKVKSLLPDEMGMIGQYGDIFTMTWEMMGFENFSYALFENESLVKELNILLGNLVLSMFEYFAQSDSVDALWYSDDIAYINSLIVSPQTLDKYFFPWLKKIGDLAKRYNKPLIYHSDGILFSVMDKIIDCGVTALHPIEPKAMDIFEVKERYGKELCLIGNIDVDLLSRGTEEDVSKEVLSIIEKLGRNGGYCIGSGNSIPEYVKFENYLAMINTVKSVNSD